MPFIAPLLQRRAQLGKYVVAFGAANSLLRDSTLPLSPNHRPSMILVAPIRHHCQLRTVHPPLKAQSKVRYDSCVYNLDCLFIVNACNSDVMVRLEISDISDLLSRDYPLTEAVAVPTVLESPPITILKTMDSMTSFYNSRSNWTFDSIRRIKVMHCQGFASRPGKF